MTNPDNNDKAAELSADDLDMAVGGAKVKAKALVTSEESEKRTIGRGIDLTKQTVSREDKIKRQ